MNLLCKLKNKQSRFIVFTCIFTLGIIFSNTAFAKQTVLLDANGNPIPEDVLMMLGGISTPANTSDSAIDKTNKTQADSSAKKDTTKAKVAKPRSNPVDEQALFEALKIGNAQQAKYLLRKGTAPVYKSLDGETPLGIAVSRGWASMVIQLLDSGADINEKGAKGVTLLHAAAAKGYIDVAKVLVKKGLIPSTRTDKNWTPLHVAARYGHWQLVQYFLAQGVDPDIRNSDGKTALGLARHLRHQGIVKILSRVTTRRSLDFGSLKTSSKKRKKRSKRKK